MKKIDKIFFSTVLYPIFPILLFLIGWWSTLSLKSNDKIFAFAIAGFILGILINVLFMRKIVLNAFKINNFWAILIVCFYSAGMFGFFMGVPVFHFFLGIPIGWFIARKAIILKLTQSQYDQELNIARIFGSIMITVICIVSAFIALNDPYTANNIKGMLFLPFDVTKDTLIAIILFGGTALVLGEYFLINFVAKTCKKFYS